MTLKVTPTPMPTFAPIPRPTLGSELTDMAVGVAVAVAFAATGLVVSIDEDDVVRDDVRVEPDSVVGVNVDEDEREADVNADIEVGDDVDIETHYVAVVDVGDPICKECFKSANFH